MSVNTVYVTNFDDLIAAAQSDFEEIFSITELSKKEKEPVILEFDDDPLALVCAMIRGNKFLYEIHTALEHIGSKSYEFTNCIEEEDRAYASEIRKFFKNTIMMRRLKDYHISNFMIAVEKITDSERTVDKEHIKILVKLPNFYQESKATEKIFSEYVSADKNFKNVIEYNDCISFVGKVRRVSKKENQHRYYFKTTDKNLIGIFVNSADMSLPLWEFISKKEKIKLRTFLTASQQPGHDFVFYRMGGDYEFSEIDN